MGVLRTAYVNVLPKTDQFDPELKKRLRRIDTKGEGERHGKVFGASFVRASAGPFRSIGGMLTRSLGGVVAGLGAVAGIHAFAGFVADAEDSAKVAKLTAATIKATGGAAKISAVAVGNLATAISNKTGKDDEAIQSGQNMLLTFKGIRNETGKNNLIFNQSSAVLTDMVSAMNGGVVTEENMRKGGIQLGKALNDPIKGITALTRVGVTFTDAQKKQIAAMVKAGDVAGAQKIILGELRSEFGGAAAATSSAGDRMKVALGNLGEIVGGFLLPVVHRFADLVSSTVVPGLMAMFAAFRTGDVTSAGFVGVMERIGAAARAAFGYFKAEILPRLKEFAGFVVGTVIPAIVGLVGWLWRNKDVVVALAGVFAAVKLTLFVQSVLAVIQAVRVWIAIQGGLNAVLFANPIGIVIGALALLVAGVILAYRHSKTFREIVQGAWTGIQTAVSYAWNNVIKPAVTALVSFFRTVIAPAALWLWNNVMKPAWAGISRVIQAAWVVIQVVFALWRLYMVKVLFPIIRFLYNNVVKPIFDGIAAKISNIWNKGIKPVFSALGSFISKYVAPAFRTGVGAIAAAWDKVKAAAAAPVRFIVDTVINKGIIGSINWLASKVGVKDRIPPIHWNSGLGGGKRPGDRTGGNIKGDGYGVGDGRGVGDGIGSLLAGPGKWLSSRLGLGRLASKFGDNPLVHTVMGAGNRLKELALGKIQSLMGELFGAGGGSVSTGGLRTGILSVLGALRSTFGQVGVISGFRPGARTLSGRQSYHALGRAIDIAPVHAWALYLNSRFGSQLRELITPWNELNINNGRPHRYTGAIWNQHNFAGGNAHIHAAMAGGGIIGEPVFGVGASGRTYSFGERGPETVVPGVRRGGDTYVFNFAHPVEGERAMTNLVVKAVRTAQRERRL
jgi:hypothetical protein